MHDCTSTGSGAVDGDIDGGGSHHRLGHHDACRDFHGDASDTADVDDDDDDEAVSILKNVRW